MLECLDPEKQCQEVILFLRKRLESQSFINKFILGSKWDGKFDKCVKILQNARDSFDLAIQIDQ
jgi:hypothetical protein